MTASAAGVFDRGVVLANLYKAWTRELARHWPDGAGGCICGAADTPCGGEVEAMREIRRIEVAWAREGQAVEARRAAAGVDTSWAPGGAAQDSTRPAPLTPGAWS